VIFSPFFTHKFCYRAEKGGVRHSVAMAHELTECLRAKRSELEQLISEQKDSLPGSYEAVEARPCPGASQSGQRPSGKRNQPPTLVVAEDEDADFILLKRALWKAGATARVWRAHNAQETLELVASLVTSNPNICLVMDVRLPGVDGCELLKEVRASHPAAYVKCAFLTGMTDQKTEAHARAEGADAYFHKPSHLDDWTQVARAIQNVAAS
jgi:CheY-like chemotaxis protein